MYIHLGWKLFKHQKDAITDCLKLGRTIMAFDMGLGKTLISLIWAKAICTLCPNCIAVVIVPCTLTEIWKREAQMIGFEVIEINKKVSKIKKSKNVKESNEIDVLKQKISIHSWSKIPTVSEINSKFVLIEDEAHAMQSINSQRTKASLDLCLHRSCLGLILSTGTHSNITITYLSLYI
jgi:N12 class adenine-specific DNA methylase